MSPASRIADDRVRDEIARAFRELRPRMAQDAAADADLDPASRLDDFGYQDIEQFINAYEALFMEALEGEGRETRDFILETALPPVLEMGQTALQLVRSNVISAVMLTHRLLPLVDAEVRHDAARWLAAFHSAYTYELAERALGLEAGRP